MDLGNLLKLPEELLYLWHVHRTGFLLSAGVVFAILRLSIHYRQSRRQKVALTPPLGTPTDEKIPTLSSAPPLKTGLPDAEGYDTTGPLPKPPVQKSKQGPKRVTGVKRGKGANDALDDGRPGRRAVQPYLFYFSLGGSTKAYAESHASILSSNTLSNENVLPPILHDLTEIDTDDFFVAPPKSSSVSPAYLMLLPTYNIDTELLPFIDQLKEIHHDFRIDTAPLRSLAGYAVFGFGDKEGWPSEEEGFCSQAVEADKWMSRLTGGKRAYPLGVGNTKGEGKDGADARLQVWLEGVRDVLIGINEGVGLGEGVVGSGEAVESADEDSDDEYDSDGRARKSKKTESSTQDLEDLGGQRAPIAIDFTTPGRGLTKPAASEPKPMVPSNSPTYASLTKQGYQIVGSHSGVKICRWTKSALRGRGSCYKFSFYGINSHLCMEATPSLSCSNKCVFCWRHGTNPVGTTWRWTVDPPEEIFDGMKQGHYKKIKMMRGVPGVRAERFEEAMRIRHCALSLVGEPIFYPHINQLLRMLHKERISTFLVCNAQHPDQLATLDHVTQLYVSIDASNPTSLKKIDRPLHKDYWARFIRCMDILREKRYMQRTVFRLTLVKGFNVEEEAEGYAALVERAMPAFVEVKGVTYCGTSTSKGAGLSMGNVPFYEEVVAFVQQLEKALAKRGLDYGIAAEHAHSCCLLLSDRGRFYRQIEGADEGKKAWHSLIDYEKFFDCLESGEEFGPQDYVGRPTADWALFGNGGFDPRDERVDRKGRPKEMAGKAVEI
ncbi:hypothetical protein K431DRAFT_289481 [Polychaeton citri CBS 116435]|uniref:tRNA 4-demethylwyosine synthase (AdoMet-dependent) n=1 Tax=Polychaeton citri CBS 116435 TaxID=1314669 RepID=A0A9P4PYE9_9PEZI|nr:hypothetical protein K431DRAFT_289481 [Polychaeton citri CBS 116435]